MDTLAIDIETYSDVSLPECGVHRYAASDAFEILLFAYSFNDEPTQIIDLASVCFMISTDTLYRTQKSDCGFT